MVGCLQVIPLAKTGCCCAADGRGRMERATENRLAVTIIEINVGFLEIPLAMTETVSFIIKLDLNVPSSGTNNKLLNCCVE